MFPGAVTPEAFSGWCVTEDSWVQSQDSPCDICGELSHSGTVFFPSSI